MPRIRPSRRASSFTESVIREMTRLSVRHGAINLSQGFPDFAAPQELKDAARQAIADDINQYPITWGAESFREAIAREYRTRYGMDWMDAERHVTVTWVSGSIAPQLGKWRGVLAAIASRSGLLPHVMAYWLRSALTASATARLSCGGHAKSGKPWARLTTPCSTASRFISRITDSVKRPALAEIE